MNVAKNIDLQIATIPLEAYWPIIAMTMQTHASSCWGLFTPSSCISKQYTLSCHCVQVEAERDNRLDSLYVSAYTRSQ